MPECIINEVPVSLSEKEWSVYQALKEDMVVDLKDEEIDAVNAAKTFRQTSSDGKQCCL